VTPADAEVDRHSRDRWPTGRGVRASLGFVAAADAAAGHGRQVERLERTATLPRPAGGPAHAEAVCWARALRLEGLIVALAFSSGLRQAVERLARGEESARPFLGVAVTPAHVARRMQRAVGLPERDGLLVRGVEDESPAARAGIQQGDLIVAAAGQQVDGIDALHRALDAASGNGGLTLTVAARHRGRQVEIELAGRRPGRWPMPSRRVGAGQATPDHRRR
jgi:hypothetical protein